MWIVIEGVDGSGKTTLADRLADRLAPVTRVREPGGTPFGDWVRATTKGYSAPYSPPGRHAARVLERMRREYDFDLAATTDFDPLQELVLFLVARADVRDSVASAERILQDRGMLSTYAYQAHDDETRRMLDRWAPIVWPTRPTSTLLLDVDPSVSLRRTDARGAADRFERRGLEYFETVRAAYASAAERMGGVTTIDASGSPDEVYAAALDALEIPGERV